MTGSDLETIRGLRSWRLATVGLSLFIYNMLLMAGLVLLQATQPALSLTPVITVQFGLAAVLLLLSIGCVLAMTPHTSDYIVGSSGRPNSGRMSRLMAAAIQDLGAALWPRWLRRTR
jgi:hypothetical protein